MTKQWNGIVATVLLTLCVPIVGQAQNIWGPPAETPEFRVEFQKPYFENNLLTGFTGVWFFSGAVPLGRRVIIVGDLPVTHTAIKDNERFGPGSFSQTDFGNPFIGLQLRNPTSPILAEFGLRLPLFSDATNISSAALFADFDRFGAFQPEFLAISAAINYVRQYKTGLGIRLRLSPEMLIDMDKHEEDNFTMALVRYAALAWFDESHLRVGGGITGSFFLTDDRIGQDRNSSFFSIITEGRLGHFRPGLQLRFPITSEMRDFQDVNVGFTLTTTLW